MFSEYFVQFGIITFPIFMYQLWTFRKSFRELPAKTLVMGIYGGLAAIFDEIIPVHIFGIPENFQCVPIILSILYGKRRAGFLSIIILSGYKVLIGAHQVMFSIIAILVYSLLPMMLCHRFEAFSRRKRIVAATVLSALTLLVELLFLLVYFWSTFGESGIDKFLQYSNFFCVACITQFCLMSLTVIIMENILEEGSIRKALKDSEKRYKSLIQNNPNGVCAIDTEDRFVMVNSVYEQITGYEAGELIGQSRFTLWFPEDTSLAVSLMDTVRTGEVQPEFESVIRHKSGRKIFIKSTIVPIILDDENVGYYSLVTDITDAKIAEELVRNSEKLTAIGQLAAGVAHEIRNPLTAVKGFVHILPSSSTEAQIKYCEIMKSELSRIEGIVSEMLVLAKPQAIQFKPICVKETLLEVIHLLAGQALIQKVQILTELDDKDCIIMGDENQIKQVFINVAKNAIEAMPRGGTLTIAVCNFQDTVFVNFADEGEGIPDEVLQKIGEPFYTTKSKGTGLGFLVSRRIIDHHKGTIEISSTRGMGTTVSIGFPIDVPGGDNAAKVDLEPLMGAHHYSAGLQSLL